MHRTLAIFTLSVAVFASLFTQTEATRNPGKLATRYTYDANGQQATVTLPDGRVTSYQYDGQGRKVSVSPTELAS